MEFKIECEECEDTTFVSANDSPEFCPMCGRRVNAEATRDLDWMEEYEDE